jgi:hypothetical protein
MSDIDRRVASRKFGDVNNNFRRGELKRLFLHRGVPEVAVYNMVEDILAERCRWTKQPLGRRVNPHTHAPVVGAAFLTSYPYRRERHGRAIAFVRA